MIEKEGYSNTFKFLVLLGVFILSITIVSACTLNINLISQDPYPIMPGENVKVVFQVTGVGDSSCGLVKVKILENFPFSVDPKMPSETSMQAGIFAKDYPNWWTIPYTLRIDKNAKEGSNKLEILLSKSGSEGGVIKNFDIEVKDIRTDFEIHVKDYSISKETITFEILNIGKNDADALWIEIPKQKNIEIKGSKKNIIGFLDSKEYTTTTFEATAKEGEINFIIGYSDITGERKTLEKSTIFDPKPFELKNNVKKGMGTSTIILILVLVSIIIYWFYKRHKRKKNMAKKMSR